MMFRINCRVFFPSVIYQQEERSRAHPPHRSTRPCRHLDQRRLGSLLAWGDRRTRQRRPALGTYKATIVAAQVNPAPPTCYNTALLICASATADGTPTPCGSSAYPNCMGASEGGCSGTNTSWECWQAAPNSGTYSKCPTFGVLPGNNNCGFATTAGGCIGFSSNGTTGCIATGGQPYDPNQGCGQINGKAVNPLPPFCP